VEVSPGATTIQDAVAANPNNTAFWLREGAYNITSVIVPKPGNQFLGEKTNGGSGVSITRGSAIQYGIATNNTLGGITSHDVKIKNIYLSGFDGTGFANGAAVAPFRCDRWELANCDFSNNWWGSTAGGDASDQGLDHYYHHNYYHGTHYGAYTFQRADGVRFEDNEITGVVEAGGQKTEKILNTPAGAGNAGATFRHNWIHNSASHGIWLDSTNSKTLIEWNLIDTVGTPIELENNTWVEFADQLIDATTKNVVRYNLIRNCEAPGVQILGSSWTEVYQNTLENNLSVVSTGEIQIELFQAQITPTHPADIRHNWIHHNSITPRINKNAVYVSSTTLDSLGNPFDRTYIIDNTAGNNWDYNTYALANTTTDLMSNWVGTQRTFPQWQTEVFQDGTSPGQDASGTVTWAGASVAAVANHQNGIRWVRYAR
jgi:parallel beta-helix repeat protein